MKVDILQTDISWASPEKNMESLAGMLHPGAGLYLLPEMWSTGFSMTPEAHAEKGGGAALSFMKEQAARLNGAVAGSVAVSGNGDFRNRFYFVEPDGSVFIYDKHHLFTYSGEDRHYRAGNEKVVVEWQGIRFRLAVCYDLRFPVWLRNRGDYDVLLCVASWPESRLDAWKTLLKARAIENQCYVMACNRTGDDPSCHYAGGSAAIDPFGREMTAWSDVEQVFEAEIDMNSLVEFRKKFPVLHDADEI